MTSPAPHRWSLVALVLAAQLAVVLVASSIHASVNNTLRGHDDWVATKRTLEKSLMGALNYVGTRQTLSGDHLNLGRWHGHQEVLHREPLALRSVELRFRLTKDAYVDVIFDQTTDGFSGLRLSRHPRFGSRFFTAREDGEFVTSVPIEDAAPTDDRWATLRLAFEADRVVPSVDDRPLGAFPVTRPAAGRFGFRGSERESFVDDVVLVREAPAVTLRESFANRRGFVRSASLSSLVVLALNGLAFALLRRRGALTRRALFKALTAGFVLLFGAGAVFLAYRTILARTYPVAAAQREAAWRSDEEARVLEEVRRRTAETRPPGSTRILIIGGSQTWGAGAARVGDTFAAVLERRLVASAPAGTSFQVLNGGVSGFRSGRLFELYREHWIDLAPTLVVLNLSTNDVDVDAFQANLERFVTLNRSRQIRTVFSLEATSNEAGVRRAAQRVVMRDVAARLGVPVVDTHAIVGRREDDGLVWWDFSHPTSFGHRLIADALAPEVERLVSPPGG